MELEWSLNGLGMELEWSWNIGRKKNPDGWHKRLGMEMEYKRYE